MADLKELIGKSTSTITYGVANQTKTVADLTDAAKKDARKGALKPGIYQATISSISFYPEEVAHPKEGEGQYNEKLSVGFKLNDRVIFWDAYWSIKGGTQANSITDTSLTQLTIAVSKTQTEGINLYNAIINAKTNAARFEEVETKFGKKPGIKIRESLYTGKPLKVIVVLEVSVGKDKNNKEVKLAIASPTIHSSKFFDAVTGYSMGEKIEFEKTGTVPEDANINWWKTEAAVKSLIREDGKYKEKPAQAGASGRPADAQEKAMVEKKIKEEIAKFMLSVFNKETAPIPGNQTSTPTTQSYTQPAVSSRVNSRTGAASYGDDDFDNNPEFAE